MRAVVPALVAVLGLVAAMPVAAAPREAGFPNEVQAVIADARKECREADGRGLTLKPGAIKKLDLNGDGRADYAVDLAHVRCAGAESLYCGTGGCALTLMIAQPDGALKTIFQGYVRTYTIAPQRKAKSAPRTIRFDLHGSACGKVGADMCFKTQTITGEAFDFKDKN